MSWSAGCRPEVDALGGLALGHPVGERRVEREVLVEAAADNSSDDLDDRGRWL